MVSRRSFDKWLNENGAILVEVRSESPPEVYVSVSTVGSASRLRDLAEACRQAADWMDDKNSAELVLPVEE